MKNTQVNVRVESSTELYKIVYNYDLKDGAILRGITAHVTTTDSKPVGTVRNGNEGKLNVNINVGRDFPLSELLLIIESDFAEINTNPESFL